MLAASCCPSASRCLSHPVPLLPRAMAEGSVQPRAGGLRAAGLKGATEDREKLVGSWWCLQVGFKRQPLGPCWLWCSSQAVKELLPWGSGSGELGVNERRWSGLSQDSNIGVSPSQPQPCLGLC